MFSKFLHFRKVLSLYLVVCLVINIIGIYIPNNAFVTNVYGAETYNLTANFDSSLISDVSSQYPIESSIVQENNTDALIMWNYDTDISNQNVTLPIEDNKIFDVDVSNFDGNGEIDFTISFKDNAGNPIPVPVNTYSIYNSFTNAFIGYQQYLDDYNINEKASVLVSDNDNGTTVDNAKFSLQENTGFSIIYGAKHYRFIWKEGQIRVYLEKDVKEGFIYELSMDGQLATYLSKGINLKTFKTEPFANDDKYMYDKIFHITQGDPWPSYDEQEIGMDISFDLPKWYDSTTGTFNSNDITKFPNTTLQLNVGTTGEKAFQLRLNDILGNVTVDDASTSVTVLETQKNDENIFVKVIGLEPGIIYTNNRLELSFNSSINVVEKPQKIDTSNKIYTFPFYDIIQVGGYLYMQVRPYVNEHNEQLTGVYTLNHKITANKNDDAINQNRNGFETLVRLNNVDEDNQKELIIFPLDIKTVDSLEEALINAREYYVEFDLNATADTTEDEEKKYYSQPIYYEPELDQSILGAPDQFRVEYYNLSSLFNENDEKVSDRSNLEMGISWLLGTKEKLDSVTSGSSVSIDFSLEKSLEQDLEGDWSEASNFTLTISRDVENDSLLVSAVDNSNNGKYEIVNADNLFITKEKVGDTVYYRAYMDYIFDAGNINAPEDDVEFVYPNIYFLTLNYLQTKPDGEVIKHISSLDDITLNDETNYNVPTATNLTTKNVITTLVSNEDEKDQVSFDIDWYTIGSDVYNYFKSLYTDELLYSDDVNINMHYNLYLSQKESHFKDEFYNLSYEERVKSADNPNGMAIAFDFADLHKPIEDFDNRIILNNINGDTIATTPTPVEYLRESYSKTPYVVVENLPISDEIIEGLKLPTAQNINHILQLDGLDTNTKYYGFLELVVEHDKLKADDGSGNNLIDYSIPSVIFAETTKDILGIPDPSDVDPSVPVVTIDDVNIKDATFTIAPYNLSDIDGYLQYISYEVLRLKTKPLDNIYLQNKSIMSEFMDEFTEGYADKQAYLLEDGTIQEFDTSTNEYTSTTDAEIDVNDSGVMLKDISLDSNKLYYYYFRTVKTIVDTSNPNVEVKTYSNWVPINITTSTIQPPKNLLVKQDEDFDRQTEVAIQFDAMISNLSDIGVNDFLEISIREGSEEWGSPIVMDTNQLVNSASSLGSDGYRTFLYTVSNLEPGKTYYFKIRHRLEDGTMSVYSEPIRWKTELGDDYDKETEIDEWDDIVEDMIEDLLNTDEWVLDDEYYKYEMLYLATKWENQIDRLIGKTFKLKPFKSDKVNTVYIPSHIYEEVLQNNLNIEFEYENVKITLNNGFINNYTTALGDIKKDIGNKKTDDYYLKINLYPENYKGSFNNEYPITDKLTVDLSLVAFDDTIKYWESNVKYKVTKELIDMFLTDDIREDIEEAVLDGDEATEILKIIEEYKEEMLEEAEELITDDFKGTLNSKYNKEVIKYSKDITYSVNSDENNVKITGQKLLSANKYVPQKTEKSNNRSYIMVDSDGSIVFTKKEYTFDGNVENLEDSSDALDIVTRYDLYDVLSTEGKIDFTAPLTNAMLAKSYSNITSKNYNDGVSSLLGLGVNINDRTKNRPVQNGTLINVLMSVYEDKTNTSIDSYKISNYVTYNNIKAKVNNDDLVKSLYVANDINLYNDTNYSENVTIETFINSLTKLQELINY